MPDLPQHSFAELAVAIRMAATRAAMDVEGTEELAVRLDRAVFDRAIAELKLRADTLGAAYQLMKAIITHEAEVRAIVQRHAEDLA